MCKLLSGAFSTQWKILKYFYRMWKWTLRRKKQKFDDRIQNWNTDIEEQIPFREDNIRVLEYATSYKALWRKVCSLIKVHFLKDKYFLLVSRWKFMKNPWSDINMDKDHSNIIGKRHSIRHYEDTYCDRRQTSWKRLELTVDSNSC